MNQLSDTEMLDTFIPQMVRIGEIMPEIILQTGGAPPHLAISMQRFLDENFSPHWTGRESQ